MFPPGIKVRFIKHDNWSTSQGMIIGKIYTTGEWSSGTTSGCTPIFTDKDENPSVPTYMYHDYCFEIVQEQHISCEVYVRETLLKRTICLRR
jgi:hypothetical protein